LDRGAVGDGAPDFVHLGIGDGDAALCPVDEALSRAEPAKAVADAVNHDVAPRVNASGARSCELRWGGIADAEGAIEGAVFVAADDPVRSFGDSVISGLLFGTETAAAERDAVLPDGPAASKKCEGVRMLDHQDGVDGGELLLGLVMQKEDTRGNSRDQ